MFFTRQIAYGYGASNIRDISYHIIYKHIISYKNTSVFPYILSAMYVIFGILGFVSLLMRDRHKNFEDPMLRNQDIRG